MSKYKAMEQAYMCMQDRYSELARALGFEGCKVWGDSLVDHCEVLEYAKALRALAARPLNLNLSRDENGKIIGTLVPDATISTLNYGPACASCKKQPRPDCESPTCGFRSRDTETAQILNMSETELRAELAKHGDTMESAAAQGRAALDRAKASLSKAPTSPTIPAFCEPCLNPLSENKP